MALTPEQIDILADKYIVGLYQQLEAEVIADIARRVQKTGRYTETAELMAKSMVEQGYSAAKIQAEVMKKLRADKAYQMAVAENTKAYKQEIQEIINETVKKAKEAGNELVAEAGNMAWNNDLSMWKEHGVDLKKPNDMSQLIRAFQIQTVGELKNLTRSMGFKGTIIGTTGVLNMYQREMDIATLKVASGTFSYDQAVNDCVKRLAESGVRSIDYESGRTYQLDTAARMSVRTGMSQLSGRITEMNLEATGQDLVITSQHIGSRPEHVPWQNKVFSYSGKSKKYPDFRTGTGYGTAGGLKGVNCTHDFHPFWDGIDTIPEDVREPEIAVIDGKKYDYYQATQQQRKMERDIRATKREIEAQRSIGGDVKELQSKLKRQTADYQLFSSKAGLRPKENRLVVNTGTSDLKKTKSYTQMKKSIAKSQSRFDDLETYRKNGTHRKSVDGVEIVDEATYNKLIRKVKKNGGIVIRGTDEVEEHLALNGSTASCIGDIILFSKNATISDVLEETYHFEQNLRKMNYKKPARERLLLNEIDAQKYLLSVADKYYIPDAEITVTKQNLADYEKALEAYYESLK